MQNYNSKIKTFYFLIAFLTFTLCLLIFNLNEVNAQQITLSISPPIIETIIKPGKTILIAFNLKNIGDPTVIKAKVLPFAPKDNYGAVIIKQEFEGPVRFSLDNSIIRLDEPFFLKSGETQQLLLRIRIPDGAPNGDYYYTLLAETQPRADLGNGSVSTVKAAIGANIIITVTDSGALDTKGKISFFDVLSKFKFSLFEKPIRLFDSNDKIPVSLIINNYGRNVIKSHGEIILGGNFGEKARFDLLPQNILSGSQRLITATPSADLIEGKLSSMVLSGFFIGKYDLTASVGFTEEGPPTVFSSISFFAFPFKITLGALAAIIIAFIIIKKNRVDSTF